MQVAKDVKVMMTLKIVSGTWIKALLEYALPMHCLVPGIYVGSIDFQFNNTKPHISTVTLHMFSCTRETQSC